MDFASLTDDQLDYPFFIDSYEDHPYTLRGYVELYGEDLEEVKIKVIENDDGTKILDEFIAWTDNFVLFLNLDLFNSKYIASIKRNP